MTNLKTGLSCCLLGCWLLISCGDERSSSPSDAGAAGVGGHGNAAAGEATAGGGSDDGLGDAGAHAGGRSGGPAGGGGAGNDFGGEAGEGGENQAGGATGQGGRAGESGAASPPGAGGAEGGAGGASAGMAGTSSGEGGDAQAGSSGAGGQDEADCAEVGVSVAAQWTVTDSKQVYFAESTPNLADPSQPDYLLITFYESAVGTFTLGQGVDASADTCNHCFLAFVDLATTMTPGPTRAFFAISGTLTVSATSLPLEGSVDALATDLTLVEVDSTTQAPLPGGACLHAQSVHVLYPPVN